MKPGVLDFIHFSFAYHPILTAIVISCSAYMLGSIGWACYLLFRR